MLFEINFWLDRRLADLPFPAQPLPVSGKPEHNELAFVVEADFHRLCVERPHQGRMIGALLCLLGGWSDHPPATHFDVSEYRCGFFCGSRDSGDDVGQAPVRQFLQRNLFQRLHQLAEILNVRNEGSSLARALTNMGAIRSGNGADNAEQLFDHRHSLEEISAVLLRRDACSPVDSQCRKYRLGPRGSGGPPSKRLAENLQGVAVERLGHFDRLSLVEAEA